MNKRPATTDDELRAQREHTRSLYAIIAEIFCECGRPPDCEKCDRCGVCCECEEDT